MATNEIPDYVLAWLSLDAKRELALKATNGGALLWQCSIRDGVGCLGCAASVTPGGAIEEAVKDAMAFLDRRPSRRDSAARAGGEGVARGE